MPGPETTLQSVVTAPGAAGSPSSVTLASQGGSSVDVDLLVVTSGDHWRLVVDPWLDNDSHIVLGLQFAVIGF